MRLQERIDLYAKAFPKFEPLYLTKTGRIEGLWVMGNNYRTSGGYGAYPHGYLSRVMSMFPDQKKILHVCSGWLPADPSYTRVDINPERRPEVCCNAEKLADYVNPNSFDIVYIDVPYSKEDAEHYGYPMLSRKKTLAQIHVVLKPGGWVIWLDQVLPMWSKKEWEWKLAIGMIKSTNHRARMVVGFEKK
jgi:hypothetical protein